MMNKPTFIDSFQKCNGSIDWRMKDIEMMYNENYLNYTGNQTERTPKIFHYVWIGGRPFPPKYKELINIWKEDHPQWEFILWNEEAIEKFGLENYNLYKNVQNPSVRLGIVRSEVLNRYGGVYIDTDFLSVKSLDDLLYLKFFAGYTCYIDRVTGPEIVMPGIIGSCPNNDMLKNIISKIKTIQTPPTTVSELFSDVLMENLDPELTVLFPPSYFYPLNRIYKMQIRNLRIPYLLDVIWQVAFEETYAIHLFYDGWKEGTPT